VENCTDDIDNDCDGMIDCDDKACNGDPACWAKSCNEYTGRINCKANPLCNWRGKDKSCSEIVGITDAQINCAIIGGCWSCKRKSVGKKYLEFTPWLNFFRQYYDKTESQMALLFVNNCKFLLST